MTSFPLVNFFFLCSSVSPAEVNILCGDNSSVHVELLPNGVQEEDDEEEMEGASHRREHSDKVVEKLKELIQTVQVCLQNNPGMQSSELTQRCKELLSTYEREYNLSIRYVSVCVH